MSTPCPFCDREKLEPRVFYDRAGWCAFLAAPHHTRGHTIVAAKKSSTNCPIGLGREILGGLDVALAAVACALHQYYQPKDILFASVRGDIAHTHCHMIPLWREEEQEWRRQHLYEKGHLLEFLGTLERTGDSGAAIERIDREWSTEDQRAAIVERLRDEVLALREVTGYAPA